MDEEVEGIVEQKARKDRQEGQELLKQEERAKAFQSTKRAKQGHSLSMQRFQQHKQTLETENSK